jgi:hypothetical protein
MANLAPLEAAGLNLTALPTEQREVFEAMTDEEIRIVVDLKRRLDATGDVEGHVADVGGVFW